MISMHGRGIDGKRTLVDMDGRRGGGNKQLTKIRKTMAHRNQQEGIAQAKMQRMEPSSIPKNLGDVQEMSMRSSFGSADEKIKRSEVVLKPSEHNPTFQSFPARPNPPHATAQGVQGNG